MPGKARGLSGIALRSARCPSARRELAAAAAWGSGEGLAGCWFCQKSLVQCSACQAEHKWYNTIPLGEEQMKWRVWTAVRVYAPCNSFPSSQAREGSRTGIRGEA